MTGVSSFVINRAVWLRGEGGEKSVLFRPEDKKMCCLGIYLSECGVDTHRMRDVGEPGLLSDEMVPSWTRTAAKGTPVCELIQVNDDEQISDAVREQAITEKFARQGVTVTFEG